MSMIYPMLTGEAVSEFSRVIYYFALFLTLFNVAMIRTFLRLKFSMSWWAYSFPLAVITSATINYGVATEITFFEYLGPAFLIISTFLIGGIFIRTMLDMVRGNIFVAERPAAPETGI